MSSKKQGLIIVLTGNGKGKTTSAIGQAFRAAGHGQRVCIIQFIKAMKNTGEAKALARFADLIELHTVGNGFTWEQEAGAVKAAAEAGWGLAREKIAGGNYQMVILDEITYLLSHGIIDEEEFLAALGQRSPGQHIIITGRQASPALCAAADLVTEMLEIKHPFQRGRKAGKGIEY